MSGPRRWTWPALAALGLVLLAAAAQADPLSLGGGTPPGPAAEPGLLSQWFGAAVRGIALLQREFTETITAAMRRIRDGEGIAPALTLIGVGFAYGVAHALGPGHGKAIIAAYFLDRSRPLSDGVLAGGWIALGHTVSAVAVVAVLAGIVRSTSLDVLAQARFVELASYGLIAVIGLWRLYGTLTGRTHCHACGHEHGPGQHHHHDHEHEHGHGHQHSHGHSHDHGHAPAPGMWRRFLRPDSMLGLLTAAGLVPCTGAMILLLFALANGVLLTGVYATLAIALGMALTLACIGVGAALLRRRMIDRPGRDWLHKAASIAASALVFLLGTSLFLGVLNSL